MKYPQKDRMAASSSREDAEGVELEKAAIGWEMARMRSELTRGNYDGWNDFRRLLLDNGIEKETVEMIARRGKQGGVEALAEYTRAFQKRDTEDLEDDAKIAYKFINGRTDVPVYVISRINAEQQRSPFGRSLTERFFEDRDRKHSIFREMSTYTGSEYYKKPGENEETLQEDALKIARSVEEIGGIPTGLREWVTLAARMYVNGVPYQVNEEILINGIDTSSHSTLSYYLDIAGYSPAEENEASTATYAADVGHIIYDVIHDWKHEHGGQLPSSNDSNGWRQFRSELHKFFVNRQIRDSIIREALKGGTKTIDEYLALAGITETVVIQRDIPDYTERELDMSPGETHYFRLISMQQIRDAYRANRLTEAQYTRAVELFHEGVTEMVLE